MSFTWEELDRLRPKGHWHLPLPPTCRRCSYILTGLPSDRCPECGTRINWNEVRRRSARVWSLMNRLNYANEDSKVGLIYGGVGWGAFLLFGFYGPLWLRAMAYIIAIACSLFGLVLGSQVLNLRRVPKWARPFMKGPPPGIALGWGAISLSVSLFLGVLLL